MKLEIKRIIPNMLVHWASSGELLATSNYSIYTSKDEGETFRRVTELRVHFLSQAASRFKFFSRVFRLGIRDVRKLKSNTLLAIADRKLFRIANGESQVTYSFKHGFGPLREGWCEDNEGNLYLSEYFQNSRRTIRVKLLKSTDDGLTWKTVSFFKGVRHIHCVQFDPFSKSIWLGTGDRNEESSILVSKDKGTTWTKIGFGNQSYRTISFIFTEKYVYWGSDIPTRQNYIYRYDRENCRIQKISPVNGPVFYSNILENRIMLFATTVEGNSEGKSIPWDNRATIWASQNGTCWKSLINYEKDRYPFLLGFGMLIFAHKQHGNNVYFTAQALRKADNMLFHGTIRIP